MAEGKMICCGCGKVVEGLLFRCPDCAEPLEFISKDKGKIVQSTGLGQTIFERYQEFLPFSVSDSSLSLGEGFTPLLKSERLSKQLGINLYFKNEAQNPTWSFKDRGTATGVQQAVQLGFKRIGTVSTGNMAASVAAYGARAGLDTFVFVSKNIDAEKVGPIAIYGPHLFRVDGDYSNLYYEALKIGKQNDIFFINSDAPIRVEGSKTIAFEICEQLGSLAPDYVVVPTSAGGNFRGIAKGFFEFHEAGLINKLPRLVCAQASGCSPICNAFAKDSKVIERVAEPDTIAHAISNAFPPSGNRVLQILAQHQGLAASVSDEQIIAMQKVLAQEGFFVQPDAAVPLAVTFNLRQQGVLPEGAVVVCILTGGGLKFTKALDYHKVSTHECKIENIGSYIEQKFS